MGVNNGCYGLRRPSSVQVYIGVIVSNKARFYVRLIVEKHMNMSFIQGCIHTVD